MPENKQQKKKIDRELLLVKMNRIRLMILFLVYRIREKEHQLRRLISFLN